MTKLHRLYGFEADGARLGLKVGRVIVVVKTPFEIGGNANGYGVLRLVRLVPLFAQDDRY
jgi:hypothetical protein